MIGRNATARTRDTGYFAYCDNPECQIKGKRWESPQGGRVTADLHWHVHYQLFHRGSSGPPSWVIEYVDADLARLGITLPEPDPLTGQ